MTVSTLLFDVDGTLIDTFRLYMESYRRALAPFTGGVASDEQIIALNPSSERGVIADLIGEQRAGACHEQFCRHYPVLHAALGEGPYEGVREMLGALRSAGLRLGVVTGKGRAAWRLTEEVLGPFEVVVTDDDVSRPKPDPEGILAALRRLGTEPEEAAYVGDSAADLAAGRSAGVRVGAALWPKTDPADRGRFLELLASDPPHWTFERPADVSRTFAAWC